MFRGIQRLLPSFSLPALAYSQTANSFTQSNLVSDGTVKCTAASNYLKPFPAPNTGAVGQLSNNFTISPNKTQFSNTYDARVDHKLNEQNLFFARFAYNTVNTFIPPGLGIVNGLQISGGRFDFDGPASDVVQQYALGYTHTFSQNRLLDLRAGFTRINNLSLPLNFGANANTTVGFPPSQTSFSPFANSLTPVSVGPFSDLGDGAFVPLQDIDNTSQYTEGRLSHKSLAQFFDTTAFAPQLLRTIGTDRRNLLFGPDFRHVDLSIFKDFPVTGRAKAVQFRAESFNISNTPYFFIGNGNSEASFGNPAFGGISQTDPNYTPREYQFALKAHF
jgi:hypothetical protein